MARMTQITNDNRDAALDAARTWAADSGAESHDETDQWTGDVSVFIEADGWGVEFRPQDGWAYLHGTGSLNGIGTNIEHIEEITSGIDRLKAAGKLA